MRAVFIPRYGGPEVLEERELPDLQPGPGQVRIAVGAAGVNFADLMARRGQYRDAPPPPCVVGYEVGGRVDALGPGADPAWLGQRVAVLCRFGGYASQVLATQAQLLPVGERLDDAQAAAIPVNWLTAWMLLCELGRVRAGDRVLIHNAAGGVGLAALVISKDRGAEVWGRAGRAKHGFLRERGCDHTLDSHADEWPAEAMDLILDPIGGRSWSRGLQQLAPAGRLAVFGLSAQTEGSRLLGTLRALWDIPWWRMGPVGLMDNNHGVLGANLGHLWDHQDRVQRWVEPMMQTLERLQVVPHVHARVPFAQAAEAHRLIEGRGTLGKVVLVP